MSHALRVALVGYGLAGRYFHRPLIQATDSLRLVSVVTADPDRAAAARDDVAHADVISDVSALWHDADEYDLVVIAAANVAHDPLARAAVSHGLHVVVDKPLAADARTARSLLDLATHHHRQVHVFQNRRWDSDYRTLRALVEDAALGRVHRLESRFERWRPEVADRWRESRDPEQMGGLLYDLGAHLVDQAVHLLGPVEHVYAEMAHVRDPQTAEDDVFVALRHHSGAASHLWASAVAAAPGPRFRVLGSRGAYVVDGLDGQEARLRAGEMPGAGWGEEPPEAWGHLLPSGEVIESLPGAWPTFYHRVAASVRGLGPAPVAPDSVLDAIRVLDAARESARTHRVVPLT
ncbi:MAG: Gfo/Idh/MocA family oxidoreductase [Jiangellales bacterium]